MTALNNYILKTIKKQTDGIITSGNIPALEDLLKSNFMPNFTKDELEREVFLHIHRHKKFFTESVENLLNYMIFDYNICEENSLNQLNEFDREEYKSVFLARSLNKELDSTNTTKKAPKV